MDTCKAETALDILVGKWKHKILFQLTKHEVLRFNELKRAIPGITQKMLTVQLRELEAEGIVGRKVYSQIPPKVEYSITEYGKTLQPILEAMHDWSEKHIERMNAQYVEAQVQQS
ncbi:winged helix-turn-helix transcriptional regulator [Litoribacterium kuwaitense]|uniref:winged helix-turn-helix transcriptional regulator n=1 Tax=Litoribacterium kuwaitense TaxID=1398745 RepID=UPI0028A67AC5|nr:helix-turn-helix domain-containing protein [Litoribacterium kuwaitense]